MIHFKRFKQARFISCRKGSDIYKIVQHFGSFFFIHSAKRISRITCRRCVHRKAESGGPAGRKIKTNLFFSKSIFPSLPITHCRLHAASRLRSIKINQGRAVVSGPLAFF